MAHLAPTYAALNTLALYGGDEAFEIVDRKKMYSWLMSIKQPDGGFVMHHGGEEDARYRHAQRKQGLIR
jgi:protein farnesyltransferase subunit beta